MQEQEHRMFDHYLSSTASVCVRVRVRVRARVLQCELAVCKSKNTAFDHCVYVCVRACVRACVCAAVRAGGVQGQEHGRQAGVDQGAPTQTMAWSYGP